MSDTSSESFVERFINDPVVQQHVVWALDHCAALCAAVAQTHGFHEDEEKVNKALADGLPNTPEGLALRAWTRNQILTAEFGRIMSEAGEAIENIRKPGPDDKLPQFPGWHVEAIDILIRVFDTLGKRGISPGEIFIAKTLVNNGREYKHGKNS